MASTSTGPVPIPRTRRRADRSAEITRPVSRVEVLGSDRVVRKGDGIVVYSPADMPEWEVRRFRRTAIRFEGCRYLVARRSGRSPGSTRYVLEPWPAGDEPAREIVYDRDYVQARDAGIDAVRRAARVSAAFALLVPLVGFLPSRWKARLHDRFGIHPLAATHFSLWVELLLVAAHVTLLSVHTMASVVRGASPLSGAWLAGFVIVVGLDGVVRYGELLQDEIDAPGFYEWLLHLRLR